MQKQNEIQIFENREFGKVRVIEINDQPWWILKDVCSAIGIGNVTDTANRLDADEKAEFDSIEVAPTAQNKAVKESSFPKAVFMPSFSAPINRVRVHFVNG